MVPSHPRPQAVRRRGFTLIELMIAMAIIGILAAVAFPSYQAQMRTSRRSEAQSFAMDVVQRQQQFLLDRRTYATSVTEAPAAGGLGLTVPATLSRHYTLELAANTTAPPTFVLTLVPLSGQSADPCGTLTVNQAGVKSASGGRKCW